MGTYKRLMQRMSAEIEAQLARDPDWRKLSSEGEEEVLGTVEDSSAAVVMPGEAPFSNAELIALLIDLPKFDSDFRSPSRDRAALFKQIRAQVVGFLNQTHLLADGPAPQALHGGNDFNPPKRLIATFGAA